MLCRYELIIDGVTHELGSDCLKNWADIECAYKRENYNGVMREFTSQFEFVNEAYDLLLSLYEEKDIDSHATIRVLGIDNNWRYVPLFECALDFSTLSYNNTTLSINAIDDGLASKINANKGTKYEFVLGEDIPKSLPYNFDRLKIKEYVTYTISDGDSQDDGSLIGEYDPENNGRIFIGRIGDEISIGGFLLNSEDQFYVDGYLLNGLKDTTVKVEGYINVNRLKGSSSLSLMRNNEVISVLSQTVGNIDYLQFAPEQVFTTIDDVKVYISNNPTYSNDWNNTNWTNRWVVVDDHVWVAYSDGVGANYWSYSSQTYKEYISTIQNINFEFTIYRGDKIWVKYNSMNKDIYQINSSEIKFTWIARGEDVDIDTIKPIDMLQALATKLGVSNVELSDYDKRLSSTLLLSAESIRGLSKSKIYSTFDEFSNWMETVFGYTYIIDEKRSLLRFIHRNELFNDLPIYTIDNIRDVQYSIDDSVLYASVEVGYDHKEYDSVNGRDEFNFYNTYTTGYTVTDKKLSLKSKYRADSYGIEFLAQKRIKSSTDDSSDEDIFFVLGRETATGYNIVRDEIIDNSETNTLFNGEFCPIRCVKANAEYISIMSKKLTLKYASSKGNADIIIDGLKVSSDIELENCDMLSAGILSFTTDDMNIPEDKNTLIQISNGGYKYFGYIEEVAIRLARPQSVQYKLIVKSKEIC